MSVFADLTFTQWMILENEVMQSDSSLSLNQKETEWCFTLRCECGMESHFDGSHTFVVECYGCLRRFAVVAAVALVPVPPNQRAALEAEHDAKVGKPC